MVVYCFVEGCNSTKYKSVKEDNKKLLTFFGFPTNSVLREKWIEALTASGHSREYLAKISKYSRICSLHFSRDCIETIGFSHGRLKPNSVPTIFPNAPKKSMAKIENGRPLDMSSMKVETIAQSEDENCQIPSEEQTSMKVETVAQCEEKSSHTPITKQIYYIIDMNSGDIKDITPSMLVKMMNMLKKSCEKKDKLINRLRVQHFRQKRKIASLEAIVSNLREKNLLPPISLDTINIEK